METKAETPSLSALLIEAVWTQGTSPDGVQTVLARFTRWEEMQGAHLDPLPRLTREMEESGVEAFAGSVLQNRQRLLTRSGGVLKAEVVYQMAQRLQERGIVNVEDVCRTRQDAELQAALRKISGVNDSMVGRFYARCEAATAPETEPDAELSEARTPLPKLPEPIRDTPQAEAPPVERVETEPLPKVRKRATKPKVEGQTDVAPAPANAADDAISAAPSEGYHVRMREMPLDERPRERLIQYGAEAVSVEELLAILLRTGTGKMNAVDLAHHLLTRHGGMRGMATLTVEEMSQIHGIGPAKAAQIKAAIEFGRRLVALSSEERTKIRSPRDVYNLLGPGLRDEKREHFIAILMDTKGGVIRQKTVSIGDLSSSLVHPREVFTEAIRHSAASMIVAHNHPSGDPAPSPDDVAVTRRLIQAGELIGIEVLDHIVLGDGRWVSLKEKGLM